MDWYLMAEGGGLIQTLQGLGSTLWVIASVALTLSFVVFVHELGHFLAAKSCGVKCEKFYIGFDVPMRLGPLKLPAALWRWQWGETEYGIGSLPLGGYVKMLGQDDNPSAQARENERIRLPKSSAGQTADGPGAVASGQADGQTPEPASAASAASAPSDGEFQLDPRSYPAKPVWQRMIIISAGVVMNLIFAVVFAAVAYRMGVRYVPCIVGDAVAALPAWQEGIGPEDQILQLSRDGQPDEQLRFRQDLVPHVVLNGGEEPMELLVRRHSQSQPQWFQIQPVNRRRQAEKTLALGEPVPAGGPRAEARGRALQLLPPAASLGVTSIGTTEVSPLMTSDAFRAEFPELAQFEAGDEIVAVDGVPLPRDPSSGKIFSSQLEMHLLRGLSEPVTLTVERPAAEKDAGGEAAATRRVDITLPPCRLRMLGMAMQIGPIASVRRGTPADQAGLRPGDRLISIAGQPLGDPATLPQRVLELIGKEIEIEYQRGQLSQTVRLTPESPRTTGEAVSYGAALGLEPLGIALPVENVVAEVQPGGPAAAAGVRPGDEVVAVQLALKDPERLAKVKELHPGYDRPIYLAQGIPAWSHVDLIVQRSVSDTALQLTLLRPASTAASPSDPEAAAAAPAGAVADSALQTVQVQLTPTESDTWYCTSRGLALTSLTKVRTAETWSEAWSLGVRETSESVSQVIRVLHGLLTGKISWTNLGGPITIATAAGFEASEGFSQLLIFLTLLSANLAVLNFLPIPALDGGHMVFLAAEGIRGKPVDERLQFMLTVVGVMFLLGLIVVLSIKDVGTLLQLFG